MTKSIVCDTCKEEILGPYIEFFGSHYHISVDKNCFSLDMMEREVAGGGGNMKGDKKK